jgi:hypothetical protein
VTLTVADAQGALSAPVTAMVNLVDGAPPAVVITKPFANQKIKLTTVTTRTKTTTVTKNGKKVKVKKKTRTSKKTKIGFAGTAKDKSGVKGVVITIERISKTVSAPKKKKTTTTKSKTAAKSSQATPAKRCNWLDPARGVVTRSCTKPVLILAKLAKDGTWTYALKSTLKLSAGAYRIIAAGQDSAGATGNSAPVGDAIHRFTLVK